MAEIKKYSLEDIKRYLQQQMSQQEMYAFEKALLNDPFLSEAFDGYTKADLKIADEHLAAIKKQIVPGDNQQKAIPLSTKKYYWWSAAATFIIIATGLIIYLSENNTTGEKLQTESVVANEAPSNQSLADSKSLADSALAVGGNNNPNSSGSTADRTSAATLLEKHKDAAVATLDQPLLIQEAAKVAKESMDMQPAAKVAEDDASIPTSRESVKAVQSTTEVKSQPTMADAGRKLSSESNDSITGQKNNPADYAKTIIKPQNPANSTESVTSTLNESLNEVVVTKASGRSKLNSRKAFAAASAINTEPQPVCGYASYNNYIQHQVDSILIADGKQPINNNIEVTFSINKNGEPVKIKVLSQVDKYYRNKAMYIIQHGPKWNSNNTTKNAKMTVRF